MRICKHCSCVFANESFSLSNLALGQAIFSVILAYSTFQTDLSTLCTQCRYGVWGWGKRVDCPLPTALQLNMFSCSQGRKVSHPSRRLYLIHLEQPRGSRDSLFCCPARGLPKKVWCIQTKWLIFCHKCQKDEALGVLNSEFLNMHFEPL